MSKNPLVSIIIPLRNLSYYLIFESLPELDKQTYKKYEIIVLPNEQGQYDLTLLRKYRKLRIIPTGKITRPAAKRDIGVKEAKGEIISFLDDDAYPDEHWVENAVKKFKKYKVEAVCGPGILAEKTNRWEKIFDEVLKTWVGSGGYSYRFTKRKKRFVTDYPSMNFFIFKKMFLDLGGFNNDYWPGEDSKLCDSLVEKKNGKILYSPDVLVYHHRRNNLIGYLKQHANYGFHRGAFFAHGDKNSRKIGYLIPSMWLLYLIVLSGMLLIFGNHLSGSGLLYPILTPLLLYCLFSTYLLIKSFINTFSVFVSVGSVLTLFLTHIVYGIMFAIGFKKGLNKNASIYD